MPVPGLARASTWLQYDPGVIRAALLWLVVIETIDFRLPNRPLPARPDLRATVPDSSLPSPLG
jgi:hypothetical protein